MTKSFYIKFSLRGALGQKNKKNGTKLFSPYYIIGLICQMTMYKNFDLFT